MPIHRTPPKETLKQLGQILERSQDSLCWGLVEDLGLSYFDLKYHQVEEVTVCEVVHKHVQNKGVEAARCRFDNYA